MVLPASGIAFLVYRTSGVAGQEVIRLHRDSLSGPVIDADTVLVNVQGLVQLTSTGNVDTIGVTSTHPDSHWGTPELVADLRALADSLRARFDKNLAPPSQRFGSLLAVNDMSLKWGGLFDHQATSRWQNPHAEHRTGKSADVDVRRGSGDDYLDQAVLEVWYGLRRGNNHNPERQSLNHQHLRVP